METSVESGRARITAAHRGDEAECVADLAARLTAAQPDFAAIAGRAAGLVHAVRAARYGAGGIDNLMHEFSLSSQEGVALMCLAEALLRIPDAATRDRLIRDKLAGGDWGAHLGHSDSLFVNAATWGLLITGRMVATHRDDTLTDTLRRAIARGGEPMIRRAVEFTMALLGQQFVMGETIEQALDRSAANVRRGYTHSFDMLGEAAMTAVDAERYARAYARAIEAIGNSSSHGVVRGPGISVKLSALHPRYVRAQRGRVLAELYPRLLSLAQAAARHDMGFNIDAEETERLDLSLDLFERMATEPSLAGWDGLGIAVQAYQKRALPVIEHLAALAREHKRRLMVRLVKGAYWDSEIKRAQVEGAEGYPVFTRKAHTDLSYLACADALLAAADVLYPQFATHNAHTLATVEHLAARRGVAGYEFQCLHGMGESLYDDLVGLGPEATHCRIYAPVGRHETLLPYLVRRLLENGANSSFVNRIVDEDVSVDELVADPLTQTLADGGRPHPAIPLPRDLYGAARINSRGVDLANEAVIARLTAALGTLKERRWQARPLLADGRHASGTAITIRNPADPQDVVGEVVEAASADVDSALAFAAAESPRWHATPHRERAAMLRRAASRFEARADELMSLCIREAGKTWANAAAEVREAVDYCRYYAARIEALPQAPRPPGVAVCISPWNFPLAIFVGQISGALAAGSTVLAKPAEQTPLVAAEAVHLLHEAGVPRAALQLLPGHGETVGAQITADARVASVLFTGSTEVAQLINRSLAAREACLVAETGGQNAMIVDSSALAEQVVQDVIASAFDSAGQRCSALRVLCLQEDIADRVLAMLRAVLAELRVGDPAELATDVGPVIDAAARDALEAHVAAMHCGSRKITRVEPPADLPPGTFVMPTLIEIERIDELEREVFGPVLHVLRFAGDGLDALVRAINATGYGLTFGLHSRIDEAIERVTAAVRAGNVYINRNMIGAVVGVQPFGGEGKSGTGPKAGGPLYLPRLMGQALTELAALGLARIDEPPAPFSSFRAWAAQAGRDGVAGRCDAYAGVTPLGTHAVLQGPTGEENTLAFAPRGRVLCLATDEDERLHQIAAALATGNTAVLPREAMPAIAGLEADVAIDDESAPVDVILVALGEPALRELRRRAASRDGALVPVITPDPASGAYPLDRLVTERVISFNNAAAGGNTTLMTLAS